MQRKHDKDQILVKGLELVREKGYNNTGIEDILKVNGIPKGSFYNFFKSKEDFIVKAMQKYTQSQTEWIRGFLENTSQTPLRRLKQFYETLIILNQQEEGRKGCPIGNLSQEMGGLSDPISYCADESMERINAVITACIAAGQQQGEIRTDYPAKQLAHYIHNSFYGALVRTKAGRDQKHFDIFMEMTFAFIEA